MKISYTLYILSITFKTFMKLLSVDILCLISCQLLFDINAFDIFLTYMYCWRDCARWGQSSREGSLEENARGQTLQWN